MHHARALQQQTVALALDFDLFHIRLSLIELRRVPALSFTRGPDLLLYGFTLPSARHDSIITVNLHRPRMPRPALDGGTWPLSRKYTER